MMYGSTSVLRKGTPYEEEFVMQIDMQGGNKAVFGTFTLVERGQQKAGDYSICGFRIISCRRIQTIWKLAGSRRLSGCWNEGKLLDSTGSRNTFGLHPRPLARLKMNS